MSSTGPRLLAPASARSADLVDLATTGRHRRDSSSSSSDDSSNEEDVRGWLNRPASSRPSRQPASARTALGHDLPKMWTRLPNDSTSRLSPVSTACCARSSDLSVSTGFGHPSPLPSPSHLAVSTAYSGETRVLRHTKSAYLRPQGQPTRTRSASSVTAQTAPDGGRPTLPWPEDGLSSACSRSNPSTPFDTRFALTFADEKDGQDLTDHLATTPLEPSPPSSAEAIPRLDKKRSQLLGGPLLKKKSSLPALRALVWSPLKTTASDFPDKAPANLTAAELAPPLSVVRRPRCFTTTSDSQCPSAVSTRRRHEDPSDLRQSTTPAPVHVGSVGRTASDSLLVGINSVAAKGHGRELASPCNAALRRVPNPATLGDISPVSASCSLANLPSKLPVDGCSELATPPSRLALLSDEGDFGLSASSPTLSGASSALVTPPTYVAVNMRVFSSTDRSPSSQLQARLASAKKLQRVLGIDVPTFGQFAHSSSSESTHSSPKFPSRPFSSAFEYDDQPDVVVDSASSTAEKPPRLVLKRETVNFAQTLLRLGEVEYARSDGDTEGTLAPISARGSRTLEVGRHIDWSPSTPSSGTLSTALGLHDPAATSDLTTPTVRNYARPLAADPFFSSPSALTPVAAEFGSSLALALAFPRPTASTPTRQRSGLVSQRLSSSRQLVRSQSYKRPVPEPLAAGRGLSVPTSPLSARRTIKKQKSASTLKESVRWATRTSSVVVVRPTVDEQAARESSETMGFLTVSRLRLALLSR